MLARYRGSCPVCNGSIQVGDAIARNGGGWQHTNCLSAHDKLPVCNRCGGTIVLGNPARGLCIGCVDVLRGVDYWTQDLVRDWLHWDNFMVECAVVALYKRQTTDEQAAEHTVWLNGRGFSAGDAGQLTRSAKWVLAGNRLDGRWLEATRRRLLKYARQLREIILERRAENADVMRHDPQFALQLRKYDQLVLVGLEGR